MYEASQRTVEVRHSENTPLTTSLGLGSISFTPNHHHTSVPSDALFVQGSSTGSPYLPSYSESRDAFQQTMLDILNLPPERMTPGFRDILAKGKELLGTCNVCHSRAHCVDI